MKANKLIVSLFSLLFSSLIFAQPKMSDPDWSRYLSKHDLVWEQMPLQWNEGAFVGNGQVGMMVYISQKENSIVFHLGRQDVTDHRKAPNQKSSLGADGATVMFDFPRLDVGRLFLRPVGKIISGTFRQHLWNAEVTATVVTDSGTIELRALTLRNRMVSLVEVSSTEPRAAQWSFKAGNPMTPRGQVFPWSVKDNYENNPKPVVSREGDAGLCVQSLLAGGDYATAWLEKRNKKTSTLYITTANEVPASGVSARVALQAVRDAAARKSSKLIEESRDWWHNYYRQSFISIPDTKMESFYWIQLYKLANASRPDGPAIDLFGPQFRINQWPGLWWNLNVQLTYWPVYPSNHLEMGENLITLIDERFDGLLKMHKNTKLGDFAWAMHNYWLQYSYAGDWKSIEQKWVPKAMKIAKAYEAFQFRDSTGRIQLVPMGSPEYNGFKPYPNTNYNLAILRWLLNTLVQSCEKSGTYPDEVAQWKKKLADLIPFPTDKNGLMIGSTQPVDMSHRHYSHLLALYPLFQLNPDDAADRELVDKSVTHWHKIGGGKELCGYSFTGAGSLYAALGRGNDAYDILYTFLNGKIGMSMLTPNTFYLESFGKNPVIETPMSCASATLELLLQSWGNKIRVFPAVPDKWKEASFLQLRAQGGFLVSASRSQSRTQWVWLKSLAGEPCVLKTTDWQTIVQIKGKRKFKIAPLGNGEFSIDLKAGEEVCLADRPRADISFTPVNHPDADINAYGVKRGKNLPSGLEWDEPAFTY